MEDPGRQQGVAKSWTRVSDFTFPFHFHALEKEMATHSSVLAWRIPGTGEPGGLPSMGSHRVRHDWRDLAAAANLPSGLDSKESACSEGDPGSTPGSGRSPGEGNGYPFQYSFSLSSTTLLLPTHLPPPSCTHAQSCNPMDCSPPGSSVHGLFQARILEWVAISFSRGPPTLWVHLRNSREVG